MVLPLLFSFIPLNNLKMPLTPVLIVILREYWIIYTPVQKQSTNNQSVTNVLTSPASMCLPCCSTGCLLTRRDIGPDVSDKIRLTRRDIGPDVSDKIRLTRRDIGPDVSDKIRLTRRDIGPDVSDKIRLTRRDIGPDISDKIRLTRRDIGPDVSDKIRLLPINECC